MPQVPNDDHDKPAYCCNVFEDLHIWVVFCISM